jgi:hypothetical protein
VGGGRVELAVHVAGEAVKVRGRYRAGSGL